MKKVSRINHIQKGLEGAYTGGTTGLVSFAGNFEHKGARATYVMFDLDSFDVEFTREIILKAGEKLFRVETERTKRAGIQPLVKINIEKGLVYWNEAPVEAEDLMFSRVGTPVTFMNLVTR